MPLQRITFKPGIVREITQYSNSGGWWDADKVRFRSGFPEVLGGWQQIESTAVLGVCRSLHEWATLSGTWNLGIGTHCKYYILAADTINDITPQRSPITLTNNPFTTTGSPVTLQVTVNGHDCQPGDYITFSGASTGVGSLTATQLNGQFQIASVPDTNTLILNIGTLPNPGASAQTGGGNGIVATPDIPAGNQDSYLLTGWGLGAWGSGGWGTARLVVAPYYGPSGAYTWGSSPWDQNPFGYPSSEIVETYSVIAAQPTIWSADNFGQDLVLNPRGGALYYWTGQSGYQQRAARLDANSLADGAVPALANGIFVSQISQNVVALGCSPLGEQALDPMQIRWSDLENPFAWYPSRTNSAGGQRLTSGSMIVAWLPTYQENLIWTDTTLYSMVFTGTQFVFSFRVIADGFSVIAPKAAVTNGTAVFWMDRNSFWIYNGTVSELPCSLKSYVFANLNRAQAWKVYGAHNHAFSEIWWFYPSTNSVEIDSYVIYNYADATWSKGTLSRTAWCDSGRLPTPIAADPNGLLYFHESGFTANGQPINAYVESADIDLGGGDQFMFLSKVIPDVQFLASGTNQQLAVDIFKRNSSGHPKTLERTITVAPSTDYVNVRTRGRRLSVKFRSNETGTAWRLGTTEIQIAPDGKR